MKLKDKQIIKQKNWWSAKMNIKNFRKWWLAVSMCSVAIWYFIVIYFVLGIMEYEFVYNTFYLTLIFLKLFFYLNRYKFIRCLHTSGSKELENKYSFMKIQNNVISQTVSFIVILVPKSRSLGASGGNFIILTGNKYIFPLRYIL